MQVPTARFFEEPEDIYHSKTGEFLSSGMLKTFIRCPLEYYGELARRRLAKPETNIPQYFVFGRAYHTLILEGKEKYREQFVIDGPINPKTGQPYGNATKKFAAYAVEMARHGKTILSLADHYQLLEMQDMLQGHEIASSLLSRGIAERVVEATWCGLPSHIRADWITPGVSDLSNTLVDLKTCDNIDWFVNDFKKYKYPTQLAYYRSILAMTEYGAADMDVKVVAQEKRKPYRVGVFNILESCLERAEVENIYATREIHKAMESGAWPTLYEDEREIY